MKVEFVNPFIQAGIEVLTQFVGGSMDRGELAVRSAIFTTQPISIAWWSMTGGSFTSTQRRPPEKTS